MKRLFVLVSAMALLLVPAASSAAAPGNDDFANASVITSLPYSASQSTSGATIEADEPQPCAVIGSTVWFGYTPGTDVRLQADTFGSDFDTGLAVYAGSSLGDLTLVECNDDGGGVFQSMVQFDAAAGTTYWFQAGGYFGQQGNLVFNLADSTAPGNDDFADATPFSLTDPSPLSGTNVGATWDVGDLGSEEDTSVWWTFTPEASGYVTFSLAGTTFDAWIAVYTGSTLNTLLFVDGRGPGEGDLTDVFVTAGTNYHIKVWGENGASGDITLGWQANARGSISVESPLGSPISEIDFGSVAVGGSEQRTVYVRNTGEGALTVSGAAVSARSFAAGEYRIVTDAASGEAIPPGEYREIVLAFEPASGPTGPPDAVGYSGFLIGQPTRAASYTYYDSGTLLPSVFETYRYFRNAGGSGDAAYTATSSNAGVVRDQASGTTTLIGGDAYWMQTFVGTSGVTSAFPRPQLEVTLPALFSHTLEFQPLPPSVAAPYLTTIGTVSFSRLADAMLVIQSDDPETLKDSPTGTFVALYGHGEGGLSCNGLPVTLMVPEGGEPFGGTAGDDVILGTDGPDDISGGSGNDTICAGPGDDLVKGGPGDDTLLGGDGNDTLRGAAGDDDLQGGGGSDRLLPDDGNDLLAGGPGSDLVDYRTADGPVAIDLSVGSGTYRPEGRSTVFAITLTGVEKANGTFGFDDTLTGSGGRNVLRGFGGIDTLYGAAGDDDLIGGTHDDVVWGGDGDDLLKGQAGDDTLYGEAGADKLLGGAGNDTLFGGDGDDTLRGGISRHAGLFVNHLDGGPGIDDCRWAFGTQTACE